MYIMQCVRIDEDIDKVSLSHECTNQLIIQILYWICPLYVLNNTDIQINSVKSTSSRYPKILFIIMMTINNSWNCYDNIINCSKIKGV